MTKAGRTVGGWRRRAPKGRTAVALVFAMIALIALASACSSSGSDHSSVTSSVASSVTSSRPFEQRTGSLIQADALGNTVIGGPDRTSLSFRYRATWTGSVVALRFYVIKNVNGRSGYSLGDGGTMRVSLEADSGRSPHNPAGRHLASATFRAAAVGVFPLVRFGKAARVVAGRLYHVVFSNIAADPVHNYVSINAMYSATRLGQGPAVPDGLAVLESDRNRGGAMLWHPRRSRPHEYYLPILDVVGARRGQHDGVGYMEVWDPKPIGGDAMVRQLLRVPADGAGRADGVWLRVRRDSRAGTPLVVRLEQPDGHALASATVAPSSVPTSDPGWVHVRFSSPATLSPGSELALTLSAADTSAYETFPIRKGTGFGFDPETFFDGGYAQFNDGSGWVGWDQWGGHDRRISDLQFALDVAR